MVEGDGEGVEYDRATEDGGEKEEDVGKDVKNGGEMITLVKRNKVKMYIEWG